MKATERTELVMKALDAVVRREGGCSCFAMKT